MDIELIAYTKQSLFHHDKGYKANIHYFNLWLEICNRMQWEALKDITGKLVDMPKDVPDDEFPDLQPASNQ
jgi:hypothetical protein